MNNFRDLRKTIFCDIDGTIFKHKKDLHTMLTEPPILLPGVIERFTEWRLKDYFIVITTARPEGTRRVTEEQLSSFGIFYNQLIMGLPTGSRMVVNDRKPDGMNTAEAVCLDRNAGLSSRDDLR